MIVLLLLQLLLSLIALSLDTRLSLRTRAMASRLLRRLRQGSRIWSKNPMQCQPVCLVYHIFMLSSYSSNGQPAGYNQSSYSQPAAYSQQQAGYQAQQAGYGQQQAGYQQPAQAQQAPPAYPPQAAGSYGQPSANQYGQQSGPPSYNQSNHYSKCLTVVYKYIYSATVNQHKRNINATVGHFE